MVPENGSKQADYPTALVNAYVALSIRELGGFTRDELAAHLQAEKGVTVQRDMLEARLGHLVATGWIAHDDECEGRYRA